MTRVYVPRLIRTVEDAQGEYAKQKRDPHHPFTRKNPWKKDR